MTSFSGCAHRWLFSQVAPVADFSPGYARRWFLFPSRTSPSLTSISGCAHGWIFLRSRPLLIFPQFTHVADLFFLVARLPRWLLFQIEPVNDRFFTGRANRNLFFHVGLAAVIFFSSCAYRWIFCQLEWILFLRWLLFQVAPDADFFPRSRPSLTFPQVTHAADFFSGSHEYVDDFLLRLRTSLNFFTGRARCWFSDCACQLLVFYRSRQSQLFFFMLDLPLWFFFKLCLSMDFLPAHTSPSLTSFSGCAHRWLFPRSRLSLILPQVTHVANFFPVRTSTSMTSFSGCAHRWLFSQVAPVADFFFRLRTSLTFTQVAPLADFSPGWACRWFLFRVARVRRWLPSQVAHIADFFPRSRPLLTSFLGCAHRWLLPRSRPSLTFPQVGHAADFYSGSHEYVDVFLLRLRTSLTSFPGRARCRFFPSLRTSLISFSLSHESFADFFFRLRPSQTFFTGRARCWLLFRLRTSLTLSQAAPFADFSPGYACRWFFSGSHEYVDGFLLRLRTSLTFFTGRALCWFFPR